MAYYFNDLNYFLVNKTPFFSVKSKNIRVSIENIPILQYSTHTESSEY